MIGLRLPMRGTVRKRRNKKENLSTLKGEMKRGSKYRLLPTEFYGSLTSKKY
jgi:hypothetical protein